MQEWRGEIDFLLLTGGHLDICSHCETVSERDVFIKTQRNRSPKTENTHQLIILVLLQTHI